MSPHPMMIQFPAYSGAFLERARKQLAAFDAGDPGAIFYAALELRFGIEARLWEHIDAEERTSGRKPKVRDHEYAATTMRKALLEVSKSHGHAHRIIIGTEEDGALFEMRYTPVTAKLASMHGMLGGMLHASFFQCNPHWWLRERSTENTRETLLDYRDLVAAGIEELAKATAGNLLAGGMRGNGVTTPKAGD